MPFYQEKNVQKVVFSSLYRFIIAFHIVTNPQFNKHDEFLA